MKFAGVLLCAAVSFTAQAQAPMSGKPVPALSSLDTVIQGIMTKWSVPGAALAVTKEGRLVYARGYGYAATDTKEPVQPDSLFRVASITKPFTAAATLKLIEQGKLSLNTLAFSVLSNLTPLPGATVDPRIYQITIQNLLEHKAGWDRDIAGDPPFIYPVTAAQAFGTTPPATPDILIRYMLGKPLQHNPGTTYAYSNFGYIVLGQIIQQVSGQSYASFVKNAILTPLNIQRMQPGSSLLSGRVAGEVKYYDYPGAPLVNSIFPNSPSPTPDPYGGFSIELMLANGGWIASTMDLLRYVDTINGQLTPNVLQSPPSGFVGYVPPVGDGWGWLFEGSLPGNNSMLHMDTGYQVHTGRISWSILFNTRPGGNPSPDLAGDADNQILAAINNITAWPSGDMFPTYSGTGSACSFMLTSSSWPAGMAGGMGNVSLTDANYCGWTATSNVPWVNITGGASGSDSGTISFSIGPTNAPRSGTITIAGQTFTVNQASGPPFGVIDTPLDNLTGVSGAIPVTGWALSGAGIQNVAVWREPVNGEPVAANGLVFMANATIIQGSRPDVAQAYPGYPNNNAGWGVQVLTNTMPNANGAGPGNGTFRMHVLVTDNASQVTDLGVRMFTADNAHAVLPFGTIDTPGQGATTSGTAYVNFGWVLTPNPANVVPKDGSTIWVYIDNQPVGHPNYNFPRSDLGTLFPGLQNSNGPVGYYMIDTTKLSNGLHTISWTATDSAGHAQGLGSRFFNVQN